MKGKPFNSFEMAQRQFDGVAEKLGLDSGPVGEHGSRDTTALPNLELWGPSVDSTPLDADHVARRIPKGVDIYR